MPRRKPKNTTISKEQELKVKKQLDEILLADEMLNGLDSPEIPPIKPVRIMNFDVAKAEVETEAKSLLGSLVKFYLDRDMLKQDDYASYRAKIDAMNISTMAFTIRTAQHAITKLMDEIDAGGQYQARNFEVLGQLQSQMMSMPEKFQKYMAEMEKTYRALNTEMVKKDDSPLVVGENGEEAQIPGILDGGTVKVRGNRTLMEGLQNIIKQEVEVKKGTIVENESILVDPRMKESITPDSISKQIEEEDSGYDLHDDLF